jgi:hypothetical protein
MILAQRPIDQWNKVKDPEMSSHGYRHLIFDKGIKIPRWRKDRILTNGIGKTRYPHVED